MLCKDMLYQKARMHPEKDTGSKRNRSVLLFIIYIFNLDVKLIGFVYKLLGKHYDDMDRERKL